MKCTIDDFGGTVDDPAIHMLHNAGLEGLSRFNNALRTGANSGYQAIGLAIAAGAARVVLVGYDMRWVDGRSHWHDGHGRDTSDPAIYAGWRTLMAGMNPPVPVLNASPGSALKCFPQVVLGDVL